MATTPARRSGLFLMLGAALLTAACGNDIAGGRRSSPEDSTVERYPAVPNDHPPGASSAAIITAAALGRGVNFGNMLEAPQEGAWGLRVEDEYIAAAYAAGFRSVRLPVRWSNHTATTWPYAVDPVFLDRVDAVVGRLLDAGFYVVLNMHHYLQLDGDGVDEAEVRLDTAAVDERFLRIWEQVSNRFRGASPRLVFELYNEPHGRLTAGKWNDLAARALGVVRRENPGRIVVIGPASWNSAAALPSLRLPNDANLVATVHNYEPFAFTHQGATWVSPVLPLGVSCCDAGQQAAIVAPLAMARSWADEKRYPVFLGEFGAYEQADMAARVRYTRFVRDQAEARGLSWMYWEFASGFGVYDPVAHAFRQELRGALLD